MRLDQQYISIDLELDRRDIIEVGAVVGSLGSDESEWIKKSWLVKPRHGMPLSPEIVKLTGITDSDLESGSISHNQLKLELLSLVYSTRPFVNPVQWGLGDAQELLDELDDMTGSKPPIFGRRVIDVKHFFLFLEMASGRALSGGLRPSMAKHGLEFVGRPHRAVDDAFNTLRFFKHLVQRQSVLEGFVSQAKELKR